MRAVFTLSILAAMAGCLLGQPAVFKLQIPEMGGDALDADVVEVPGQFPQTLLVHVLNPIAADVDYGRIQTKLNGEGAGYITSVSVSPDGKIARMDLKLREGMRLVPGTNTLEVQATNRHGRKFYRNFLIKTREQSRNQYFAYETKLASGDTSSGPDIVLAQPEAPITLGTRERTKAVLVKGTVSSVNPLATVTLAANAVPLSKPDANVVEFEREVQVQAGQERVLLEAVDRLGSRAAVTIPVHKAVEGRPVKIEGGRYALIIGISEYAGKDALPRLSSASLDARDLAKALTDKRGFKPDDVLVLTDAQATHAQVLNGLRNFSGRAGPDDLLIIFFAGYGLHDPLDPSRVYLAAYDTQLGQVPDTAISIDDLKTTLGASIRSRQAVLLFDVNHPLQGAWTTPNNNLVNKYLLRLFPDDPGKAVMVASSVAENAAESSGGGLFARHLIDAAEGQADANQDGVVTIREWFLAVSRSVQKDSHGAQNPRFTLQQAERPLFAKAAQ